MKASDIISRIRGMSGDSNALQFTDSMLLDWINAGVRECAVNNNLLQKSANQTSVIGQDAYDQPADILKLHSVKYNGVKLDVLTLDQFDARFGTGDVLSGTPSTCYFWASKIRFFPVPDSPQTITIDYIYDPVVITDVDTEIPLPVGYHQRILDYCLAQVAQQDDDMNRYQIKMQEFLTGVSQLKDQQEWTYDEYPSITVSARDSGIMAGDNYWDLGW